MTSDDDIVVEVAYALPEKQKIIALRVAPGTTAYECVQRSNIGDEFPGLDIETARMGIFGQAFGAKGLPEAREYLVQAGDRIEIYRPLIADPKEVRRRRAAQSGGDAG